MRSLNMAIFASFLIHGHAEAGGCRAVVQKAVAAVVTPVVPVVPITAVTVQVPTFAYSYAPAQSYAQQQVQAETSGDCCAQLVAELAKLRGEVAALRGIPTAEKGNQPANLLESKCAKCHSSPAPKGEFAMFGVDGKRLPLSIEYQRRVTRRVQSGAMPPKEGGGPLTEAEKVTIFETLKEVPK